MTRNPLHDIATGATATARLTSPRLLRASHVPEASMRATLPTRLPLLVEATGNQATKTAATRA